MTSDTPENPIRRVAPGVYSASADDADRSAQAHQAGQRHLSPDAHARLQRLRNLAKLMDGSFTIPGLDVKVGLDPIIGLVPVLGDIIAAGVSIYIVQQAWKMGIRRRTLWMLIGNVAIDLIVGEIPALGDLFDFAFKANQRNMRLIEAELNEPPTR